jgi:hypothetical protein
MDADDDTNDPKKINSSPIVSSSIGDRDNKESCAQGL